MSSTIPLFQGLRLKVNDKQQIHNLGKNTNFQSDYIKTAISLAAVALRRPFSLLASLVPHLVVLGAFGAFVLWNNGVVLGQHNSNLSPG